MKQFIYIVCSTVLLTLVFTGHITAGEIPDVQKTIEAVMPETILDRRHLHAHPELSHQEFETQKYLQSRLSEIPGITFIEGNWTTGIVAILKGKRPEPLVAYRADMDALPVIEKTGLPYASTATGEWEGNQVGIMHACGHDVHMSVLLGAARVLSSVRRELPGSVMFILQPAEETADGAVQLIQAGLFEKHKPAAIFGLHVSPECLPGQIGYRSGPMMANVDWFTMTVHGKGGHGAYPHLAIDPIVIASRITLALQTIVSREINPADPSVITVGYFHAGTKPNIIPESVELQGTVRSYDSAVRKQLEQAIRRTAEGIAASAGAPKPEMEYKYGTSAVVNNPELTAQVLPYIQEIIGTDNCIEFPLQMGGEDFSEYQQHIPGFFFRLGVGRQDQTTSLHNPEFAPDENAIPVGIHIASHVLWKYLRSLE